MILHVKFARPRSGRPQFFFPSSSSPCSFSQCHAQDTRQLCWLSFCLYYHFLLYQQRYDSTSNISTTTSTKTKPQSMSQITPASGRITPTFLVLRTGEYHSILCFLTNSSMETQRMTISMAPCSNMILCKSIPDEALENLLTCVIY